MENDGTGILVYNRDSTGLITFGKSLLATPTTANKFAVGCVLIGADGTTYTNAGTVASPSFQNINEINTSEIAAGAVTPVKTANEEAITATSDGLTTGIVSATTRSITVTSASADNIVALPASVPGKVITGYVGANGCELRTVASSGETINGVDSDGTNEAAIPATTFFRVTGITGGWILEATTELGIAIAGIVPDAA